MWKSFPFWLQSTEERRAQSPSWHGRKINKKQNMSSCYSGMFKKRGTRSGQISFSIILAGSGRRQDAADSTVLGELGFWEGTHFFGGEGGGTSFNSQRHCGFLSREHTGFPGNEKSGLQSSAERPRLGLGCSPTIIHGQGLTIPLSQAGRWVERGVQNVSFLQNVGTSPLYSFPL